MGVDSTGPLAGIAKRRRDAEARKEELSLKIMMREEGRVGLARHNDFLSLECGCP